VIYCDTSYLVRLYLDEPGSEEVRTLCSANSVASSIHALAEIPAAFHRAYRERRLDYEIFKAALIQLETDRLHESIQWLELPRSLLEGMTACYASMPATTFLRAADAIHLACAAAHGFTEVYSNDRHFLAAAPLFGLRGVNVIAG
jgi:predicted nucleic acid-binding protein